MVPLSHQLAGIDHFGSPLDQQGKTTDKDLVCYLLQIVKYIDKYCCVIHGRTLRSILPNDFLPPVTVKPSKSGNFRFLWLEQ